MRHQRTLDLCGAETMAGDVDHVVDAPGDPVIAILVAAAAVAGEILTGVGFEVCFHESLMIAIDRTHLPRPGLRDTEISRRCSVQHFAIGVDDLRNDPKKWARRGA